MHYFLYKTTSPSGKYYIGRHCTTDMNDGYMGSGKWVRSIRDKSELTREIILFCPDMNTLLEEETSLIAQHIDNPLNMNFNNSSVGFGTGDMNPSSLPHVKEQRRKRAIENNPVRNGHTEESKKKISDYMTANNPFRGKTHTEETRKTISEKNTGHIWSEEQKQNLSAVRRKDYNEGKRSIPIFDRPHTEDTKMKMSKAQLNRPKKVCPHCNKLVAVNLIDRWHNDNCKHKQ